MLFFNVALKALLNVFLIGSDVGKNMSFIYVFTAKFLDENVIFMGESHMKKLYQTLLPCVMSCSLFTSEGMVCEI